LPVRTAQDRVPLRNAKKVYESSVKKMAEERTQKNPKATGAATAAVDGKSFPVKDGAVLIAAITSCTNTSNRRFSSPRDSWPATPTHADSRRNPGEDLAGSGSRVVTDYLQKAGLLKELETLGFYTVGYGCTTCIGNSGPLKPEISEAVKAPTPLLVRCFRATAISKAACIRKSK